MKNSKGGTVSPTQKAWHKTLSELGLDVFVANGASEAINYISGFFNKKQGDS